MPRLSKWREVHANEKQCGEELERLAARIPLPDGREWVLEYEWYKRSITTTMNNATIQEFAAEVKRITDIVGPPTTVDTYDGDVFDERAPDLRAAWQMPFAGPTWIDRHLRVILLSHHPQCPIDPRTRYVDQTYIPAKRAALHPECSSVMDELAELCEG